MNEVNEVSSSRLMKTFAVVGFVGIVIFLVWLAIQIVGLLPSAFSTLASLAESVQNRERTSDTLTLETSGPVANAQEAFTVSWNQTKSSGSYWLEYSCTDGVSLEVRLRGGTIVPVPCGQTYVLPAETYSVDMAFASTKERFADVSYKLAFVPKGKSEPTLTTSKTVTLVNATIPAGGLVASATDTKEDEPVAETTPVVKPTPKPVATPQVLYKPKYVTTYKVPVSDPNGFTDLAVSYLGVGTMGANNVFVNNGFISKTENGAISFKVKNTGTKTSGTWAYKAELPSGETYNSPTQLALKPNEEANIVMAFGQINSVGTKSFKFSVSTDGDNNSKNNSYSSSVVVKN